MTTQQETATPGRPLGGIRVADFSQLIAGPSMAVMLGDLGADVVKVERLSGEICRSVGAADGMPPTFIAYNRGKRSVALDLSREEGREVAARLIATSDVVIEGFRPGAMDRLGLGAAAMRARNPRLIYVSITAYSEDAEGARPGVDAVIQAASGLMAVTGETDGPPTKVGFQVVDAAAGLAGGQAVLAALLDRAHTGLGTWIRMSLFEVATFLQSPAFIQASSTGRPMGRPGNSASHLGAPTDLFATSDGGHVMIAAYFPDQWTALCAALGRPELAVDERFSSNRRRIEHNEELRSVLSAIFATETAEHWDGALRAHGVIGSPVRDHLEIVSSPRLRADGGFTTSDGERAYTRPTAPYRLGHTAAAPEQLPPTVGQHSAEVMAELGFSDEEIKDLIGSGVVGDGIDFTRSDAW